MRQEIIFTNSGGNIYFPQNFQQLVYRDGIKGLLNIGSDDKWFRTLFVDRRKGSSPRMLDT